MYTKMMNISKALKKYFSTFLVNVRAMNELNKPVIPREDKEIAFTLSKMSQQNLLRPANI